MKTNKPFSIVVMLMMCLAATCYQAQAQHEVSGSTSVGSPADSAGAFDLSTLLAQARRLKLRGFSLMPESANATVSGQVLSITPMAAGPNLAVLGGGRLGRLPKWTGFTSSNSFIGDSGIYEDKLGKVGIGVDTPTSKLTVAGTIEASGGFKFPDGSVQTTAGVVHDQTLTGKGTAASPLSVVQSEALIEPVAASDNIAFSSGGFLLPTTSIFTVPVGKRLIIEHVSASCSQTVGKVVSISIATSASVINDYTSHELIPVFTGLRLGAIPLYQATQTMKLYGFPGSDVRATAGRDGTTGSGGCTFQFSGFMVDLP